MPLTARFDNKGDRRAHTAVSVAAAVLSYAHARALFLPFMGGFGASVTPLMLDAVLYWLATACIRQALKGRPLPMLRSGAYVLLALSIAANALGGATWSERVFMALPAALFGYLTEVQIRLALYEHRAEHGSDRLGLLLWLRHPVRSIRAKLWQARKHAPSFDSAGAERDRLSAARDAVRLAMPGQARDMRRARRGVLRELNAGRLTAADAVTASGLMDRSDVPGLHRAALAASLGSTPALPPAEADIIRAEMADTVASLRADIAALSRPDNGRNPRPNNGTAIRKLLDKHPDLSTADIAARLGIADRTVRRHLSGQQEDDSQAA